MKTLIFVSVTLFSFLNLVGCQPESPDDVIEKATDSQAQMEEAQNEQEGQDVHGVFVYESDRDGRIPCPEIYDPVCAQPPMPECPPGQMCPQVMPQPRTYDNECEMKNAGAKLISAGECEAKR